MRKASGENNDTYTDLTLNQEYQYFKDRKQIRSKIANLITELGEQFVGNPEKVQPTKATRNLKFQLDALEKLVPHSHSKFLLTVTLGALAMAIGEGLGLIAHLATGLIFAAIAGAVAASGTALAFGLKWALPTTLMLEGALLIATAVTGIAAEGTLSVPALALGGAGLAVIGVGVLAYLGLSRYENHKAPEKREEVRQTLVDSRCNAGKNQYFLFNKPHGEELAVHSPAANEEVTVDQQATPSFT